MSFDNYTDLLKAEVLPAQGCTEPIAVAYAVSLACEHIKGQPSYINIYLSPNIIKNALGVGIPGTGKLGVNIAAALGAVIKKSEKKLDLLNGFTKDELNRANELLADKIIKVSRKNSNDLLYIEVQCGNENESSKVIIKHSHTNVILIKENDNIVFKKDEDRFEEKEDTISDIESIYEYIQNVSISDIEFLYDAVKLNLKVSEEGLRNKYGLEIGYKMARKGEGNLFENSLASKTVSATAAAVDARMGGCTFTVMTTGGSGNQGIASSLPVIKIAEHLKKDKDDIIRALALSNLITLFIKQYIGRLSPLCGSGIAGGAGASSAITYMQGGSLEQIKYGINNMLSGISGMICDGAKESCALKIALGTQSAIQCSMLALNNIGVRKTDGIIFEDANESVKALDYLVKNGFKFVDETVLDIMVSKNN
ncbi:MAG: serine dehydratase subunit alpha family protein [Sarcina sp.]